MNKFSLKDVPIGNKAVVLEVKSSGDIKRRLLDIGLSPNTVVEVFLTNPGSSLKAYMIRGALIAIRDDDAKNIVVEEYRDAF